MSWSFVRKIPKQLIDLFIAAFEVSDRGVTGLGVYVQNLTTPLLPVPFLKGRATLTLTADTVIESRVINVLAGHGATVGEVVEIADNTVMKFIQSEVVSSTATTITLDQPINRVYTVANSITQISSKDLLVDGSVAPQIFSILPLPNQAGDITGIIMEMRGDPGDAMDFTKFGSGPALVNGCVLRVKNSDGTFTNIFNFKSNSDFFEQGFKHQFLEPKTGNTITGLVARLKWGGKSEYGSVVRLDGSLTEELQLVIQDPLDLSNTRFHLTGQGAELQEQL